MDGNTMNTANGGKDSGKESAIAALVRCYISSSSSVFFPNILTIVQNEYIFP